MSAENALSVLLIGPLPAAPLWPCVQDCLNGLGLLLRLELRGYRDEVQVRLEPIAERLENEVSVEAIAVLFKAARFLLCPVGRKRVMAVFVHQRRLIGRG